MSRVTGTRRFRVAAIVALALVSLVPASASATLLSAGLTLYLPAAETDPSGGSVVASLTQPFSTAVFSGTLTTQVISGDPSNPFGGLTFTYQLANSPSSANMLQRLTVNDFATFAVDASYQASSFLAPTLIDRNTADTVGFSFLQPPVGPGGIAPGMTTSLLVLQTDSTAYASTQAAVIDGAVASVASFAPVAVPEPSTIVLLVVAAFGFCALARRSRRISAS
jgi:hypothetical protein